MIPSQRPSHPRIRPGAFAWLLLLLPVAIVAWVNGASAQNAGTIPSSAKLDEAIDVQRQRIAETPTSAEAHNDLGNLLALRQERDAAEDAYREAIRLDPGYFSAHFNLGVLLRSGHRPEEAIDALKEAIALEPSSAWSYFQLGAAHQALGRREKAIDAYARAFALDSRLALPDVNPLIIGNSLVTAALLHRPEDVPVADTTPRSYADPVRISQLLLPPPPPPVETAQPPAEPGVPPGQTALPPTSPAVGEVRPRSGLSTPTSDDELPDDGAEPPAIPPEGDTRRITSDDIRSLRILNQAAPPPPEATPPARGGTREGTDLSAPQRFRPGRRSSAQLELRLIPEGLAEPASPALRPARS